MAEPQRRRPDSPYGRERLVPVAGYPTAVIDGEAREPVWNPDCDPYGFRDLPQVRTGVEPGTVFDKIGADTCRIFGRPGDSFNSRSLTPYHAGDPYDVFVWERSPTVGELDVLVGTSGPDHGRPGGGHRSAVRDPETGELVDVIELLDRGLIRRLTPQEVADLMERLWAERQGSGKHSEKDR